MTSIGRHQRETNDTYLLNRRDFLITIPFPVSDNESMYSILFLCIGTEQIRFGTHLLEPSKYLLIQTLNG